MYIGMSSEKDDEDMIIDVKQMEETKKDTKNSPAASIKRNKKETIKAGSFSKNKTLFLKEKYLHVVKISNNDETNTFFSKVIMHEILHGMVFSSEENIDIAKKTRIINLNRRKTRKNSF